MTKPKCAICPLPRYILGTRWVKLIDGSSVGPASIAGPQQGAIAIRLLKCGQLVDALWKTGQKLVGGQYCYLKKSR